MTKKIIIFGFEDQKLLTFSGKTLIMLVESERPDTLIVALHFKYQTGKAISRENDNEMIKEQQRLQAEVLTIAFLLICTLNLVKVRDFFYSIDSNIRATIYN